MVGKIFAKAVMPMFLWGYCMTFVRDAERRQRAILACRSNVAKILPFKIVRIYTLHSLLYMKSYLVQSKFMLSIALFSLQSKKVGRLICAKPAK